MPSSLQQLRSNLVRDALIATSHRPVTAEVRPSQPEHASHSRKSHRPTERDPRLQSQHVRSQPDARRDHTYERVDPTGMGLRAVHGFFGADKLEQPGTPSQSDTCVMNPPTITEQPAAEIATSQGILPK